MAVYSRDTYNNRTQRTEAAYVTSRPGEHGAKCWGYGGAGKALSLSECDGRRFEAHMRGMGKPFRKH